MKDSCLPIRYTALCTGRNKNNCSQQYFIRSTDKKSKNVENLFYEKEISTKCTGCYRYAHLKPLGNTKEF